MNKESTPARWSQRLYQIRMQLDKVIDANKWGKTLPPLHANDYEYYMKSVIESNPFHIGDIFYRGRKVTKSERKVGFLK